MYFVHVYNQIGQAVEARELVSLIAMRRSFLQVNQQQYIQRCLQFIPTSPEELEFHRHHLLDSYLQEEKVAVVWMTQLQHSPLLPMELKDDRDTMIAVLHSYKLHCQQMVGNLEKNVAVYTGFQPQPLLPPKQPS